MIETEQERQQMRDQVARSLSRVGVGKAYHARKLSEFGKPGEEMKAFQDESAAFKAYIENGKGWTIKGNNPAKAYDFAVVAARSFHLMRFNTRVLSLVSIADYLSGAYEHGSDSRFENFEAAQCLVIPRFYEPLDSLPLTRAEFYKIENFLTQRIEAGYSLTVQYSGDLSKTKWWSDYFLDRLVSNSREIVI